jgi:hypothetical protein
MVLNNSQNGNPENKKFRRTNAKELENPTPNPTNDFPCH